MGKLVIDGNKVYTVDESCMRKKNLTLEQVRRQETASFRQKEENQGQVRR